MSPHVLFSLTATATAVALAGLAPALGQTLPSPAPGGPAVAQASPEPTYTLIHVSAVAGSDSHGDGSQLRPYQTITHALQGAAVNSIVVLAAGEYSEASGERFPIQLKAGVTVQGAPGAGPGQTVIRGSGILTSPTEGLVHATVVGVDGAGLGHVTVTNTSTSGYGLVIEAGRPVIRQNVFVGSGYGGVYVGGQSAPVIEGNQFRQNGVVGLAISGQSTAEVRNNRFEQTGIGIRVAPGAQPQIVNNQIFQNQEGIVLDGSAQPRLQDNVIAQNRRNGVVEFQTAIKAEPSLADRATLAPPAALQPDIAPALEVVAVQPRAAATEITTANASLQDVIPPPPARPVVQADRPPATVSASTPAIAAAAPGASPVAIAAASLPPAAEAAPANTALVDDLPRPQAREPLPESMPLARLETVEPAAVASSSEPLAAEPPAATAAIATPNPATEGAAAVAAVEIEPPTTSAATATPAAQAENAAPAAVEIAVLAPTSPGLPPAQATQPQSPPAQPAARESASPSTDSATALATARAWLRQIRQRGTTSPTLSASSSTGAEAIPLRVIPPPVDTPATPSSAVIVRPNPVQTAGPANQPTPIAVVNPSADTGLAPLQVPGGNIPLGSGGASIPNLAAGPTGVSQASAEMPPPPPSHAAMLGLVYRVFVPATDATTQAQVRAIVGDAFRVNLNGQTMMQVGAYADQATAEAKAAEMVAQGFEARVEHNP